MRRITIGICTVGFLALSMVICPDAPAQAGPGKTTILALVAPAPGADPSLTQVLQAIVRVQLARRRLAVVAGELAEPRTPESIGALAGKLGASHALVATYRTSGEQVELSFELRNAADGAILSSAARTGRIDLVLDDIVSELLDRLLADQTLPTETIRPSGGTPGTGPAAAPGASAPATPGASPAAPPAASPATPAFSGADAQGAPAARPAGRWRYFGVSVGAAPLVMAGPTTDLAKLGLLATAEVAVRIPVGAGALALGVLSGYGWLHAEGIVTSADISLVPVGLDARYAPAAGSRAGVSLHLSGGAALMRVVTPSSEPLMKIVPYGLAGLALDLPLTAFLGLAVEASFVAFLEASLPIMAFSPTLALRVRI